MDSWKLHGPALRALRRPPLPAGAPQAGVHLADLADLRARRGGRRHGAAHRAGADDRPAGRAARSLVGSTAHVYVFKAGGLQDPDAESQAAAQHSRRRRRGAGRARAGADPERDAQDSPIQVKGIVPELEPTVTNIGKSMQAGSLDALDAAARRDLPGIVLGKDLARQAERVGRRHVRIVTAAGER